MKRGAVWTVAGAADYAGKPRPAVIIQDMRFDATDSVTLALCTSDPSELPLFRVAITPDATNGLRKPTSVMADKITTILRAKLGNKLGTLSDDDMRSLDTAIIMFLGLAE